MYAHIFVRRTDSERYVLHLNLSKIKMAGKYAQKHQFIDDGTSQSYKQAHRHPALHKLATPRQGNAFISRSVLRHGCSKLGKMVVSTWSCSGVYDNKNCAAPFRHRGAKPNVCTCYYYFDDDEKMDDRIIVPSWHTKPKPKKWKDGGRKSSNQSRSWSSQVSFVPYRSVLLCVTLQLSVVLSLRSSY